jgi:hypothetical protein
MAVTKKGGVGASIAALVMAAVFAFGSPAEAATCAYSPGSKDSGGIATVYTKKGCIETRSNGRYDYVGGETWTGYGPWSDNLIDQQTIISCSPKSIGGVDLDGSKSNVEYSSTAAPTSYLAFIAH